MKTVNPLKLIGIVDGLLLPVQRVVTAVLPDFLEQNLKNPQVRKQLVAAADDLLIKQYPEARLLPEATRRRIIAKTLDIVLDDILLSETN